MKERNNLSERFAIYLKEVIEYYHENGSLKHFSVIALKHQITAIPQEIFFKHGLNKMQSGSIPTIQQCHNILEDIRNRRTEKRKQKEETENTKEEEPKFKERSIIAWKCRNGNVGMAYIGKNDFVLSSLNRLGIDGEEENVRFEEALPYNVSNDTWQIIEPKKEDYERFIRALSDRYIKECRKNTQKTLF